VAELRSPLLLVNLIQETQHSKGKNEHFDCVKLRSLTQPPEFFTVKTAIAINEV
jgi:hypothetical protein